MKKVWAIAMIAVRNAVRSRVVAVLLVLLVLSIIGLPLTVKGDGTLTGQVQILLSYSLGFAAVILSIATLWAGCAAISQEVLERQIHLIVTKPVYRVQVWLGKWCGLLVINLLLLALAGAVTYGSLRWSTRPGRLSPREQQTLHEEILVARRLVAPEPVEVDRPAREIFEEQQRRGEMPPNTSADQVMQAIRKSLVTQANSVPLGYARRWRFRLPAAPDPGRPLLLRYKFSTSSTGKEAVAGIWVAGPPDRPDRLQRPEMSAPEGVHTIVVPGTMVDADGILTVEYGNVNPAPVTVIFAEEDGMQLLVYEGGFEANLVRALLVLFLQLAFLGALAVTAGSLFSLPVAALASAYCVLLMKIGPYIQSLAEQKTFFTQEVGPQAGPNALDYLARGVYLTLNFVVQPLQTTDPLGWLSVGRLVSWGWVATSLLTQVGLGAGALLLLSAWLFNRREIGLPA